MSNIDTNRCVTVSYGKVSGEARRWPYWQPAVYEKVVDPKGGYR